MGKSLKRLDLILIVFFFLQGCSTEDHFEGNPFGIIALDSTRLSVNVLADHLQVPWDLTMGPENTLLFTQQKGTVNKMDLTSGEIQELLALEDVHYQKSRGLLSMALHPGFKDEPIIFLHYNYLKMIDSDTLIKSRLVSYKMDPEGRALEYQATILDEIPGQTYHNGSRMVISPDRKILLTTGDAGVKKNSQDPYSLSGKLLRINLDGTIPEDNPYPNSYTYVTGLRNSQGLVFGRNQMLYGSDHGPNNDDEINILREKANYGWPIVEGYCNTEAEKAICIEKEITEPIQTWTPTAAVAGIGFYDHDQIPEWKNTLLVGALKAQFLAVLHLNDAGTEVTIPKIYLQSAFGRIRDVVVAESGEIYLSTSNHDWHPKSQPWMYDSFPAPADDRIIRISALKDPGNTETISGKVFREADMVKEFPSTSELAKRNDTGESSYLMNCANCHLQNGQGIPNLIPPLADTDWVTGDKERLIRAVLEGLSGEIEVNGKKYNQEMPGFQTQLSDQEIAVVLTFIRSSFGNHASEVSPVEVAELRK